MAQRVNPQVRDAFREEALVSIATERLVKHEARSTAAVERLHAEFDALVERRTAAVLKRHADELARLTEEQQRLEAEIESLEARKLAVSNRTNHTSQAQLELNEAKRLLALLESRIAYETDRVRRQIEGSMLQRIAAAIKPKPTTGTLEYLLRSSS